MTTEKGEDDKELTDVFKIISMSEGNDPKVKKHMFLASFLPSPKESDLTVAPYSQSWPEMPFEVASRKTGV